MIPESDKYFKANSSGSIDYFRKVRERQGKAEKYLEYFLQ